MAEILSYRGRVVTDEDVVFIQELIDRHPSASRRSLSKKLCEAWGWVQPNGVLCDMVCRGLMLALHRGGHIELPPVRFVPRNNVVGRRDRRSPATEIDTTPLRGKLREIGPLEFRQVRRTAEEPLFHSLIEQHHYLGYRRPVGAHLEYLVYTGERPIACVSFASAARHLGPRDRFLGWSAEARRRNVRFVAYNPRYLILPWVQVKNLASHVLSRMARRVVLDWKRFYGHPLYFLETFVDRERYRGTCYVAANWIVMGRTKGRGNNAPTRRRTRSIKDVLGYPLTKRFRELLESVS